MALGDGFQPSILQVGVLEWRVALDHDASLPARGQEPGIEEGRCPRDLVDGGNLAGGVDEPGDLGDAVVADTDAGDKASVAHSEEPLPGRYQRARPGGPVDEPQVDVVQTERTQARLDRALLAPGVPRRQLGRHAAILAPDVAIGDRPADLLLVPIHRRGVDEPVTDVERSAHCPVSGRAVELPRPEPDEGHRCAAREGNGWAETRCHATVVPYISPNGSLMSSRRSPSGPWK